MTVQRDTTQRAAAPVPGASDCRARVQAARGEDLALPAIASAHVKSLNAFYCRRPVLTFAAAGRSATISASWPPALRADFGNCRLAITVDGSAGALILSRALVEAAMAALDPDQALDRLDPRHAGLLLELALSDELVLLEARLGARISITSLHERDDDGKAGLVSLDFALSAEGFGTSSAELRLQPGPAIMFGQFLDRCAAGFVPAIDLPVAVCVRVAAAIFSAGDIATLMPGDVVMVDQCRRRMRTAVAVIAEHLVAPVELTAAGGHITAAPMRGRGSLWEWSMENVATRPQADMPQRSDLDDLPVKLLFELGRIELSLAEIRQLAPGALVPLARPLEDSVDILANGCRVGRGNLVKIGDSLGIRITRLFDNA